MGSVSSTSPTDKVEKKDKANSADQEIEREIAEETFEGIDEPSWVNGSFLIGCSINQVVDKIEAKMSCDLISSDSKILRAKEDMELDCTLRNGNDVSEWTSTIKAGEEIKCQIKAVMVNDFSVASIEFSFPEIKAIPAVSSTVFEGYKRYYPAEADMKQDCLVQGGDFESCSLEVNSAETNLTNTEICNMVVFQGSDHNGGTSNFSRRADTCNVCDRFDGDVEFGPAPPMCPSNCTYKVYVDVDAYNSKSTCEQKVSQAGGMEAMFNN